MNLFHRLAWKTAFLRENSTKYKINFHRLIVQKLRKHCQLRIHIAFKLAKYYLMAIRAMLTFWDVLAMVFVLLSSISMAGLVVGARDHPTCPVYPRAAIWLIVFGVLGFIWWWLMAILVSSLPKLKRLKKNIFHDSRLWVESVVMNRIGDGATLL